MSRVLWSTMRVAVCAVATWVAAAGLEAQGPATVLLTVEDPTGRPIAHAVVEVAAGVPRLADDSGRVALRLEDAKRPTLRVRRLGFREWKGALPAPDAAGRHVVVLDRLQFALDTVRVLAAATPLATRGFYDRVARVQRGAIVGEFITPEELEDRDPSLVSRILTGRRYVRIGNSGEMRGRPIVLGRNGCGMTIILDGQRVNRTLEQHPTMSAQTSIMGGTGAGLVKPPAELVSIDEIVDGRAVAAIEIYPSTANAPAELIPLTGGGSCGIVAIWTGVRK